MRLRAHTDWTSRSASSQLKRLRPLGWLFPLLLAGCPAACPPIGPVNNRAAVQSTAVTRDTAPPATAKPISNHGGEVMRGPVNVYYVFYGTFSDTARTTLTDLAANLGGARYWAINEAYDDASGHVSDVVTFAGATDDPYSHGTALSEADIADILSTALTNGVLPTDDAGVYFVLTASDVTVAGTSASFCSNYCGWHDFDTLNGTDIKYAFVGDPTACMASCAAQATGPNGDAAADAMASVIAHELAETVTDPHLDAWYDADGEENADKCAWTFGTEYAAPNGARANVRLGDRDYLLQQNWVRDGDGYCGLETPALRPNVNISFADIDDEVFVWVGQDAHDPRAAVVHRGLGTNETVALDPYLGSRAAPADITVKLLNSGCFESGGTIGIVEDDALAWQHVEAKLLRHCGWIYRAALRLETDGSITVLDEQPCIDDFDARCAK